MNARTILATSVAALLTGAAVSAQTVNWDGSTDANWSVADNWSAGIEPTLGDAVLFPALIPATGGTITLSAAEQALSLSFLNSYTLTGGDLTLGAVSSVSVDPTFTATINSAIGGAGTSLTKSGNGTLVLGGTNTYAGQTIVSGGALNFSTSANLGNASATNTLAISNNAILRFTGATAQSLGTTRSVAIGAGGATIDQAGTAALTLQGAITSAAGDTFTKTGNGTVILTSANNAWSGDINVNAGTFQVGTTAATQYVGALGATTAGRTITIASGATLDFLGRDLTGGANFPAFVVNGGTIRNSGGFTRLGNVTLNGGTIHVIQGNSATFQALTFQGDVTVTGTTPSQITTTGGASNGIHLEKSGGGPIFNIPNVTGDANADLSIAVPLVNLTNNAGASGFTKNGNGTLALTGANTFTGTMTINDGTVVVNTANTANAPLAFGAAAGGTPLFTTNVAYRVGNVTQSAAGGAGTIDGTGTLSLNGDRTFNIADGASVADLTVNVPVVNGDTTGRGVIKTGAGTLQFNGVNTFSGTLTINDGTVVMNASQSAAGGLSMGNTAGVTPRLVINSGVTYRLNGNPQTNAAANGNIIEGAGSLGLFADRAFIILDSPAADDLVVSVPIANGDATARAFRKEQTGRMVVQGDNTYTGQTDIYRGTLVLDYSVNNGSKLVDTGTNTNMRGGVLVLSGNATAPTTEVVTGFGVVTGTSTVQLAPTNGQALTFNLNAINRTVGQGLVNFVTPDAALATFQTTTTNNLQGLLGPYATFNTDRFATVSSGALAAVTSTIQSDRSQWQASQNVVVDSALTGALQSPVVNSLVFDAATSNTLSINNSAAAFTVASGGILVSPDVAANNTAITGGQLMVGFNTNGGGGELVLTNLSDGTLSVSSNIGSNTAPLTTSEHLTAGGRGLIEISGRNVYSGQTNIQGNVRIAGGNAFSDFAQLNIAGGGDMVANGGALLDLNGTSEGIGNLSGGAFISQGASEIQLGTGGNLTINQTGSTTYQGLLTGSGTVIKKGGGTLTLTTNAQAFTGEFQVLGGAANLTGNNPGLTGVSTVLVRGGALLSQQDQGGSVDKIANAALVRLEGTANEGLRVTSNQNATRTETADRLELNAGSNVITMTNTAGTPTAAITVLTFANATDAFTRNNNATLLARSGVADFGGTSTAQTNRLTFASGISGDLVGGGGAAGTTNISILPFAVGGVSNVSNPGDTFVTIGTNGIRPLNTTTEYATNFATAVAADNLSLNASVTDPAVKTFNSLRIDNSAGNVDVTGGAGSSLTLTSGALLVSAGANANDTIIGGYDQIRAGVSDANADELVIHVTSSNAAPGDALLTVNSVIADNGAAPTSLTKSGGGTVVLGSTNTYTGATTINQGSLQFGAASQLGGDGVIRLAGGTLTWGAGNITDISMKSNATARTVELLGASPYLTPVGGNLLNVGNKIDVGANNVTFANAIGNSGVGGLSKAGSGTLTLSVSPNYSGPTLVREGTMNFATIAPNSTSALWLVGDTGTVSSTVTSGLNVQSLIVGGVYAGTESSSGTLTVNGGVVNIGDGGGDDFVLLGFRSTSAGASTTGTTTGTANFSNAASVTMNVAQVILAQTATTSGSVNASLVLSNTSNSITASQFIVGNSPGPGQGSAPSVTLGTGTNDFAVDTLVIGGQKINGSMSFATGATTASTFKLRGLNGDSSGANLFIGDNDAAATGTPQSATTTKLDLGLGTADVKANLLVIGRHAGGTGNGAGSLIFGAGTIEAQTINLAVSDFRGGSTTTDANTVGVITQNGGTMRFQELSKGNGTATYNWNAGTIGNISGSNLTNKNVNISLLTASAHTFSVDSGSIATFESGAGLVGAGGLTKAGDGTLVLGGTNSHSGATNIDAGTLLVTGSVSASAVNVNAGTVGGSGSIATAVNVGNGSGSDDAILSPGMSIGTLTAGSVAFASDGAFKLEINSSLGTNNTDLLTSTGSVSLGLGIVTLNASDLGNAILPAGQTFTFINATGGVSGTFAGLPDGAVLTIGTNAYTIDYQPNSVSVIAVPEPGSILSLLGGLAVVAGLRRFRRN